MIKFGQIYEDHTCLGVTANPVDMEPNSKDDTNVMPSWKFKRKFQFLKYCKPFVAKKPLKGLDLVMNILKK